MPTKSKPRKSKSEIITQNDLRILHNLQCATESLRIQLERDFSRGAKLEPGRFKRIHTGPTAAAIEKFGQKVERRVKRQVLPNMPGVDAALGVIYFGLKKSKSKKRAS